MSDENTTTVDPNKKEDNQQTATDPSKTGDGQSNTQSTGEGLPEQFKGKSAEEIANSFIDLQKKFNTRDEEVKTARQAQAEVTYWRQLGQVIKSNPALYKLIEEEVVKQTGEKPTDKDKDGRSRSTESSDTRSATSGLIIGEFEKSFGLDKLSEEKRKTIRGKIGDELSTFLDPKGLKSKADVFNSIPLDMLPSYLEKGYKLATDGDRDERARSQAYIEARRNADATFGEIPNAGTRTSTKSLTQKQRDVARKMGMTEEEYIKNL